MDQLGLDSQKMVVTIDCPYAQYVEFGSDPATKSSGTKVLDAICGDYVTQPRLEIRDWVQTKFNLTPEERKERGDKLYKKIMEEGMGATPFIRPALYFISSDLNEHPDKYLKSGDGMSAYERIANELAGFMARSLLQHESVVSGDLLRSIKVVPESEGQGEELPEDLRKIPPEVWEDMNLDRHGNWIRPKGRIV